MNADTLTKRQVAGTSPLHRSTRSPGRRARGLLCAIAVLLALTLASCAGSSENSEEQAQADTAIRVQLPWLVLSRFAGLIAKLDKTEGSS